MIEPLKRWVLRVLRVPPEPHPPSGSPGSTTIFRASRNYYYYNLLGWGLKQAAALVGFLLFLSFTLGLELGSQVPWRAIPLPVIGEAIDAVEGDEEGTEIGEKIWWWFNTWIWRTIETVGLIVFVVQFPITYSMVRLDYEMRWYIVTDRSLRIREGITSIREMTMTFANVQHLDIRQGPLQRLFKISDLRVRTAGGGSSDEDEEDEGKKSMHIGYLRGVERAEEVRDAILARLKLLRGAGLGDPDDRQAAHVAAVPAPAVETAVLSAARELLGEARELRRSFDVTNPEG